LHASARRTFFGTFRILFPHGETADWDRFRARPFHDLMDEILPGRAPTVSLVVSRRHPEQCAYFLHLFDRAASLGIPLGLYIPFLCHRVSSIPVQWIVYHVAHISDARFGIQLARRAFTSLRTGAHDNGERGASDRTWRDFLKLTGRESADTAVGAWRRLVDVCAAMRELVDYRLRMHPAEYARVDKREFVRSLIAGCPAPGRLRDLLARHVRPYSEANAVNFVEFLIEDVGRRDWPVEQKLALIHEFVTARDDRARAVEARR